MNVIPSMNPETTTQTVDLFTIGYSVRKFKVLVNMLIKYQIDQVIDVRLNDFSDNRDFNGQSKDLSFAFRSYGIYYEHRPKFGNPRFIKRIFKRDRKQWRIEYFSRFKENDRGTFQHLFTRESTVLMCSEKDFRKCHRTELAHWIARGSNPRIKVKHL